jgi:hypothetical protein
MTLQGLSKYLDKYDTLSDSQSFLKLKLLQGLPFYNWQNPNDTNTFNHAIGLPHNYFSSKRTRR